LEIERTKRKFVPMKKVHVALAFMAVIFLLVSCSDAEIVSGTFHGKIYKTDTLEATVIVTKINDGYIRIYVTSALMNESYTEYAQLHKNAPEAYNLSLADVMGGYALTGYYYENFLHVDSWSNHFMFEGNKD
jgi:hypothetical protein